MRKISLKLLIFGLIYLGHSGVVFAADELIENKGQIKICRYPGIIGSKDGKLVNLPADGTYTGAPLKRKGDWDNGRSIVIRQDNDATLGRSKNACVVVDATLIEEDGKPVEVGQRLVAQFSIEGFTEFVTVVKPFKPKKVRKPDIEKIGITADQLYSLSKTATIDDIIKQFGKPIKITNDPDNITTYWWKARYNKKQKALVEIDSNGRIKHSAIVYDE
jgi:regulator of extracellular matrix RemA (YlzA/DUF370 family)